MFEVIGIPAFKDNYIWLIRKGGSVVVVDPGESRPVLDVLMRGELKLRSIFVTHHHSDHQGGVTGLVVHCQPEVYGSGAESITAMTHPLYGGERIFPGLGDVEFEVLSVPGHTAGHLAFYADNCLFCGDTLFGAGCGRIFEGTPNQMYDSLLKLAALPDDTRIYCAHEYTEANLRFALAVEPGNLLLRKRAADVSLARAQSLPTVPSTLALEKATNPFLRCAMPEVIASVQNRIPGASDPRTVFAALREWKNSF
ncbi:hydroxyacylglutathione hydrolase [Propionivibrio limicola]|uniref:hydroxyacylglutathione hydrolase n=1 Tax=Propionivibrio limicola TaxID=167645 RepID=UPI001291CE02|nr:hydroxyacylglutathione hydrolase [Propionivibrio limicola]